MQCKKCKVKLLPQETMVEFDEENQRIINYFHCSDCNAYYSPAGEQLFIPTLHPGAVVPQ